MTDKQIIIEDCPHFIGGCCQEYLDGVCENHKCDLKIIRELEQKLKAKEQECEELKKYIKHLHNLCGNETDKQYKLKQTLTEIKEYLKPYLFRGGVEPQWVEWQMAQREKEKMAKDIFQILQKISECEVE